MNLLDRVLDRLAARAEKRREERLLESFRRFQRLALEHQQRNAPTRIVEGEMAVTLGEDEEDA